MEVFILDGPAFVKWIETMLILNDISKETFYSESGISTANMTQWRAGDYNPSKKSIEKAERFFENRQKEKPATENGSGHSEIDFIVSQLTPANQTKLLELARLYLDHQRKTEESL